MNICADRRVGKTDSGGTFSYVRDRASVTDPVLGDGAATYTPGVSQHRSGATTFENEDYLGTSTRQTNSSQSTTATRSYDAFGNLVSTTGTPVGLFGFVGKAGYQEDGDSGLKLLGHRYYDPSTGRFLTRDHAKDGRNWYGYAHSSPLKGSDPSGLDWPWNNPMQGPWYKIVARWLCWTNGSAYPEPYENKWPITISIGGGGDGSGSSGTGSGGDVGTDGTVNQSGSLWRSIEKFFSDTCGCDSP